MADYSALRRKKLFLFDLDGTLYLGDTLFPGAKELLACIRARGGQYRFLTNNSSRSVAAYVKSSRASASRRRQAIFSPRSMRSSTTFASMAEKTDAITSAVRSR